MDGAGLGLGISKHIVEAHGGTIRVISKPGEGSTFVFTLPVAEKPYKEGIAEK
jgi:two-component system OmpR family sensor kinase